MGKKMTFALAFNIKQAVKATKNPRQDNYTAIIIKVKRNMYD